MQKNCYLEKLILVWNGFGFEGSVVLKRFLENNILLFYFDFFCNWIYLFVLFEIIKGLEKNKMLFLFNVR